MWNYYTVDYWPREFILTEDFESICEQHRGGLDYQESLTEKLAAALPPGEVVVNGRHHHLTLTETRNLIN